MKRALLFICFILIFIPILFAQQKAAAFIHQPGDLQFIENKNQWANNILYQVALSNGAAFVEKNKITFNFINEADALKCHHPHKTIKDGEIVHLHSYSQQFVNANASSVIKGENKLSTYHNYFLGNDKNKWASNVPLYEGVIFENIYNGIHLHYRSIDKNLKYEFEIEPYANANQIKIQYNDVSKLQLKNDLLYIKTSVNEVVEDKPYCYQEIDGKTVLVNCDFVVSGNQVHFKLGKYNAAYPLIIDPTVYCTYTGSLVDNWGTSAASDAAGNVYAAGIVSGIGYPTTAGAYQVAYGGGLGGVANWNPYFGDISVTKFDSTCKLQIYSTYLGGTDNDYPNSIIVTPNNELIVFGRSYSTNYPVTTGCFQNTNHGSADITITKFNATGSALIGSTYIGGSGEDGVNISAKEDSMLLLKRNYGDDARGEVNLDVAGNIYIASCARSTDFPTSLGCFQNSFHGGREDGIICKLNSNLSTLIYGTYIGGNNNDACYSIDVDQQTNMAYVTGGTQSLNFPSTTGSFHSTYQGGSADGFLLKLNTTGTALIASTFIGTNAYDQSYFVNLDKHNFPYIMGQTSGTYPVKGTVYSNPNSGQFISRFNKTLDTLQLSTVVGNGNGQPNCSPTAFMVDECDNVFWAGWGGNFIGWGPGLINNMPLSSNANQTTNDGGTNSDFYMMVLSRNFGTLRYGSYYGGNGSIEHVDGGTSRFSDDGCIYGAICAGCGGNSILPASAGAYSTTNKSTNCNLAAFRIRLSQTTVNATAIGSISLGCVNQPIVVSTSSNAQSYFWDFGDGTTSTLQNPSHQYTVIGNYTIKLIVTDSTTCNIVDSTFLPFSFLDDSVKASFSIQNQHICTNDTVRFNSSSTIYQHTSYYWKFGDGDTSILPNPNHQYLANGKYIVTLIIKDTFTCNYVDSFKQIITVGVYLVSDSLIANKTKGCPPLVVNFNSFTNNATNYVIDFGDGSPTIANTANPSHTYNTLGVYTASIKALNNSTCNDSDIYSIQITVDTSFVKAKLSTPILYGCTPFTVNFSNSSFNASNYIWYFGDGGISSIIAPTHTYSSIGNFTIKLIATDTNTCNKIDSAFLYIRTDTNKVHATAQATPTFGCIPLNVQFLAFNNNATSLLWNFGDINNTTSTIINPNFVYTDTGTFNIILIATDTSTCNRYDTSSIVIHTLHTFPTARFKVSDSLACSKLNVSLTNLSQNAVRYLWSFGDNTTSTLFQPTPHFFDTTYFNTNLNLFRIQLVAYDSTKCIFSDTDYHDIKIFKMPNADFKINPAVLLKPDSLFYFFNKSYNADNYTWLVDNNFVTNKDEFYASWYELGKHTVCLISSSNLGCADTICKEVEVDVDISIGVPNAFSPDADGQNDFFKVYGYGIDKLDFRVFNRWGQLVFQTNDRHIGWDGTYNGKQQEMDVYAWTVNVTFLTGEKRKLKGNVTLVR